MKYRKNSLLNIILILTLTALLGCSKKEAVPPVEYDNSYSGSQGGNGNGGGSYRGEDSSISLPQDGDTVSSEVSGGVTRSGKYTGKDGVSASGINMVYFSSDRYDIEPDQLRRLQRDMPKIRKLASISKIRVEGNCDEFGTGEYNQALGLKRARAVKSVLINSGIPARKISIVSYGESNPICTGNSAPCHAKNRRVEINRI